MRSVSPVVGVLINTVSGLLTRLARCIDDETVREVQVRHVQTKSGHSATQKRNIARAKAAPVGAGDVWTWAALDSGLKRILFYEVGDCSRETAIEFMDDLWARLTPGPNHY